MEDQPKQTRLEREIQEMGDRITKEEAQELREMSIVDSIAVGFSQLIKIVDNQWASVPIMLKSLRFHKNKTLFILLSMWLKPLIINLPL